MCFLAQEWHFKPDHRPSCQNTATQRSKPRSWGNSKLVSSALSASTRKPAAEKAAPPDAKRAQPILPQGPRAKGHGIRIERSPRPEGERPQRDGDERPRRPRREGDERPRRDDRPRREGDERPRRDGGRPERGGRPGRSGPPRRDDDEPRAPEGQYEPLLPRLHRQSQRVPTPKHSKFSVFHPPCSRPSDFGYTQPTKFRPKPLPIVLAGKDIVGASQTGTGKTAAFGMPALSRLGALETSLPHP